MRLIEHVLSLGLSADQTLDLLTRISEQEDKPKVLAIDMDDTLLKYVRGGGYGAPLPGMVDLLKRLRAAGWKIAIWTCRPNVDRVKEKLKEKGIPFDWVNDNPLGKDNDKLRKIHADVYLDDKAITATGSGDGLLDKILNFQSWSKRAREEKKKRKESVDESLLSDLQKATKGLNIKDLTWALNRIQSMTDGGNELAQYSNLGTAAYGLNWALASGRLTMEAEKHIKSLDLKGLCKLLDLLARRCHTMNDVVSFMNNNRWTESIDEAATCQNYNHSSGACEDGCVRSGVQMGASCPWAPDWETAQKNPDQGGCFCYG